MAGQLHEVLAVFQSIKNSASTVVNKAKEVFTSGDHLFNESLRTYEPLDAMGESEPDEHQRMAMKAEDVIREFAAGYADFVDVGYQIDKTNLHAVANIKVGDLELKNVPATWLMQFDKQLAQIKGVYDSVPVLDPKFEWKVDEQRDGKVYKAEPDDVNYRTRKELKHKVLVDATEHHPAQVEKWAEDIRIGTYTTKRWASKLTYAEHAKLMSRITELQKAVKRALSDANKIEHDKSKVGRSIFDYINKGL